MVPRPALPLVVLALFALVAGGCGRPSTPDASQDPQLITFEGGLANRFVRAEEDGSLLARIRVGTRAPADRPRGPVNVALVIDTSGSMEGQPIADARKASLAMIDALSPGDRLAVVAFHSKEEILLPSTELEDADRAELRRRIEAMRAQGTTDMARGLRVGLDEVKAHLDPKGINRVVLLGDGVPNDAGPITGIAQEAGSSGITVTALGLGPDYDETLMGQVAQLSGGRFHYVEDSAQVATFFQNEVLRLQGVYAKNATVALTPGPGVRVEGVLGQQVSFSGATAQVSLGDLSKGETRDLVVRLAIAGKKPGAPVELLDAVMTFDDVIGGAGRVERRVFLGARSSADAAEIASGRNPDVELSAAIVEAAATTVTALEAVRAGQNVRAREMLERGAEQALEQAKRTPSAELEKQARNMRAIASDLPKLDRGPTAGATPGGAPPRVDRAPSPAEAPMPAPAADLGGGARASAARKVREVHDEAMQHLQ